MFKSEKQVFTPMPLKNRQKPIWSLSKVLEVQELVKKPKWAIFFIQTKIKESRSRHLLLSQRHLCSVSVVLMPGFAFFHLSSTKRSNRSCESFQICQYFHQSIVAYMKQTLRLASLLFGSAGSILPAGRLGQAVPQGLGLRTMSAALLRWSRSPTLLQSSACWVWGEIEIR